MNDHKFLQRGLFRFFLQRSQILAGLIASAAFWIGFATAAESDEPELDPVSGMIVDENWEMVQAMCSACHSPKLFTNYGATRQTWASLIDWMQEKQGLWAIPAEIEEKILTYLEKNYPPGEVSRRRNLSADLRPPNPYVSAVRAEFEAKQKKGEIAKPEFENSGGE